MLSETNNKASIAGELEQGAEQMVDQRKVHDDVVAVLKRVRRFSRQHKSLALRSVIALTIIWVIISILWQPRASFTFSSESVCVNKPVVLSGLHRPLGDSAYKVELRGGVSLFGLEVFSRQACAVTQSAPSANSAHVASFSFLGNKLLVQKMYIKTQEYPLLATDKFSKPIAISKPLVLPISTTDKIFDYHIHANEKTIGCAKNDTEISCAVRHLGMTQGAQYNLKITRSYKGAPAGVAYEGKAKTADPIQIASYSVEPGSLVYEQLSEIRLIANKELSLFSGVSIVRLVDNTEQPVEASTELSGSELTVRFIKPLERRAKFKVVINEMFATDNGQLEAPLMIEFTTSGGPAVKSASIGSSKVDRESGITLTFDQALASTQNISKYISLTSGAGPVPFKARIKNNLLVITPDLLGVCTPYTLTIHEGVESAYGVVGDAAWVRRFRTRCAVISTIGYSVNGRAIQAYRFGTGPSKIVYVGGMHGNEKSSYQTMSSWIDELENNPDRIPAHRTIIVIPNSNPDGTAANRRTNANNVDLNRNFPADDWTPGVYMPGPTFVPEGGGSTALSEPESKALASYIQSQAPRLVLTYHAVAAVVIGNGAGDSGSLASAYANKSRYSVAHDSQADDIFSYSTTGEFEDWLHDKHGIPGLLVELATVSGNEFSRNSEALWAMASLP